MTDKDIIEYHEIQEERMAREICRLRKIIDNLKSKKTSDKLVMDDYDDCIEGVVERFGQEPIVCYNKQKVLKRLMDDGCSLEEAIEFHEFNQLGAWIGEGTPCFLDTDAWDQIYPELDNLNKDLRESRKNHPLTNKEEAEAQVKEFDKVQPGSNEAIEIGCTCPIMDNEYGEGYMGQEGTYIYNMNCPIHKLDNTKQKKNER